MLNDDTFLNGLADFTDLKAVPRQSIDNLQNKSGESDSAITHTPQLQLQLQSNAKLLKNFKQLREQLREANKQTQRLRGQINSKDNQLDRLRLNEKDHVAAQYQLKNEVEHLKSLNEDFRVKLQYLKQATKSAVRNEEELEYLKITNCEQKSKIQRIQAENKKNLEISIIEKVELEEKIKKYEAQQSNDLLYVQDMEIKLCKMREKCIKLENELKKTEIKYEEQLYNKKWVNGNFQKQHFQQQLANIQRENEELRLKNKKEKQKRNDLEKRVLELEEMTGLWTVKAEAFQEENKNLHKRYKQVEKNIHKAKEQSSKKAADALCWEERFMKSVTICQELICRVKRELYGDMVSLAKSCEFKLNKLKEQNQFTDPPSVKKISTAIKSRSKSKSKFCSAQNLLIHSDSEKPQFQFFRGENESESYKERIHESESHKNVENQTASQQSGQSRGPLGLIENIEVKIKREREEMQKKIREKMLYRKIEVANSPQKHRLREDYFRLIDR